MKNKKTIWIVCGFVFLLLSGIVVGMNLNKWFSNPEAPVMEIDDSSEEWTGNKETYTGKKIQILLIFPDSGQLI